MGILCHLKGLKLIWRIFPSGHVFKILKSPLQYQSILMLDINAGLVACSQMMGQCIREDIAQMFAQFHTNKAALGADFLRLNKEKGWLVPPPLHINKTSM